MCCCRNQEQNKEQGPTPPQPRSVDVLGAGQDGEAVEKRIEERRQKLRAEVKRGEGKLANEGFVAKAPADVVDEERAKLEAYRAELEELA